MLEVIQDAIAAVELDADDNVGKFPEGRIIDAPLILKSNCIEPVATESI